jgi:hypothetical protein
MQNMAISSYLNRFFKVLNISILLPSDEVLFSKMYPVDVYSNDDKFESLTATT